MRVKYDDGPMAGDNDGLVAEWKRDSNQASTKCERKLGVTDQPEQTNDAFSKC